MTTDITTHTIRANMIMLEARLYEASERAADAITALTECSRNQAIGTLLPLERELEIITALMKSVVLLHSMKPGILDDRRPAGIRTQ